MTLCVCQYIFIEKHTIFKALDADGKAVYELKAAEPAVKVSFFIVSEVGECLLRMLEKTLRNRCKGLILVPGQIYFCFKLR